MHVHLHHSPSASYLSWKKGAVRSLKTYLAPVSNLEFQGLHQRAGCSPKPFTLNPEDAVGALLRAEARRLPKQVRAGPGGGGADGAATKAWQSGTQFWV